MVSHEKVCKILILDLIYFVFTITLMIIVIISNANLGKSDHKYIYKLGINWMTGPISLLNTDGTECNNQTESYLITDSWPGLELGCDCPLFPITKGRCSRKRRSSCSTIGGIAPIQYKKYKGKNICGQRLKLSYLDLTIAENPNLCSKNMRSCGIIDSLNNVMCISTSLPCPLNYIKVLGNNEPIPTDRNYSVLQLNNSKIIVSNENTGGKILNEFVFSDDQPCANPNFSNYAKQSYILDPFNGKEKCDDKVGNYQFDERYYKIDTYDSYNLVQENNIIPFIVKLPSYPDLIAQRHPTNLYARNFIGIKAECLNKIREEGNSKNLIYELSQLNSNTEYTITLAYYSMILAIILCSFVFGYIVALCFCKSEKDSLKIRSVFLLFTFGIAISICVITYLGASSLSEYSNISSYLTQDCVEDLTYQAVSNSLDNGIKICLIISSFLGGLCILIPIIAWFFTCL